MRSRALRPRRRDRRAATCIADVGRAPGTDGRTCALATAAMPVTRLGGFILHRPARRWRFARHIPPTPLIAPASAIPQLVSAAQPATAFFPIAPRADASGHAPSLPRTGSVQGDDCATAPVDRTLMACATGAVAQSPSGFEPFSHTGTRANLASRVTRIPPLQAAGANAGAQGPGMGAAVHSIQPRVARLPGLATATR
jgi:hypothetical protein